ncbi:MAG: hypothetical protein ACJ8ER_14830 [Allosphingosinicella sp.]
MGVHRSKTFRSGASIALRLPGSLAIAPGESMLIEDSDGILTVRRVADRAEVRRKLRALLDVLEVIGRPRAFEAAPRN